MPPIHHESSMVTKMLQYNLSGRRHTSLLQTQLFHQTTRNDYYQVAVPIENTALPLKEITFSHYRLSLPLAQTQCLQISSKC